MRRLLNIINHRDFVLILALVCGFALGERSRPLAEISMYSLALVMVFATTGFSFKSWLPLTRALRSLLYASLLNYLVFGLSVVLMAWFLFRSDPYFSFYIGLVLVAAAPPGPSVIPFSAMLKGDNNFAVTGVFGLHLLAVVLTPLILLVLLGQTLINPFIIIRMMLQLIVVPLVISRVLRHPRILPKVESIRNTVVKWGFFLVITPIVGMSVPVFINDPVSVARISGLLFLVMFILGLFYHVMMIRLKMERGYIISSTLMLVIKSSAFAAVAAFTFFRGDPAVALPPAVVSVFVTLFIVFYSQVVRWSEKHFVS
jgi:predicted Na+-dependent transporter